MHASSANEYQHPPPPPPPPLPRHHPSMMLPTGSYIHQYQYQYPSPWSTGLFDCCDDKSNCLLTLFCPCVTFGKIAEIIDGGSISCGASGALYALVCCVTGWACLYSCCYRSKMRKQYNIEERPCADCFVHCCCESCALCQEYRELKRIDLRLGREPKHATMAPVVEGRMSR